LIKAELLLETLTLRKNPQLWKFICSG